MKELDKRKKWLSRKTLWNCFIVSAAILIIATFFEYARFVITTDLPIVAKILFVFLMWAILFVVLVICGLVSPYTMKTIFEMLGFKDEDKNNEEEKSKQNQKNIVKQRGNKNA